MSVLSFSSGDSRRLDGLLCEDGIHPSPAGQQIMAEAFEAFMKKI